MRLDHVSSKDVIPAEIKMSLQDTWRLTMARKGRVMATFVR